MIMTKNKKENTVLLTNRYKNCWNLQRAGQNLWREKTKLTFLVDDFSSELENVENISGLIPILEKGKGKEKRTKS